MTSGFSDSGTNYGGFGKDVKLSGATYIANLKPGYEPEDKCTGASRLNPPTPPRHASVCPHTPGPLQSCHRGVMAPTSPRL